MIMVKDNGIPDRILTFLRVPHLRKFVIKEPSTALFYILLTCKHQAANEMEPDPENMEALKQLLDRAALKGEPIDPEETMARLMSSECLAGEISDFIRKLIAGGRITEQDVFELFFSNGNRPKLQIPPKQSMWK
jgi:hypothetical protein